MARLDTDAQKHLDEYLAQVRTHLRGCSSVDPDEVERDVRQHIECELQEAPEPVCFNDVDAVLKRLGSPAQWVPDEDLPWWRKLSERMRSGPEDWRLAYVSFGLLILGLLLGNHPSGGILLLASAILSRAALASVGDDRELGAQKWLIYPSLILVYVLIGFLLLFGPTLGLVGVAAYIDASNRGGAGGLRYWVGVSLLIGAATGLWWFLLGSLHMRRPNLLNAVFRPFLEKVKRTTINRFRWFGAAVSVICLITFGLLIS